MVLANNDYGAGSHVENLVGHASHEQPGPIRETPGSHHDRISVELVGYSDDGVCGVSVQRRLSLRFRF